MDTIDLNDIAERSRCMAVAMRIHDYRKSAETHDEAAYEITRLHAELVECKRDAERYRTALEQIVAPFEDLNFVSGNKLLTYIHDVATAALAAKGDK